MNLLKTSFWGCIFLVLVSCSNDDVIKDNNAILADYLSTQNSIPDNVIACAANSKDKTNVSVYFFPERNTTNYRLYLSKSPEFTKTDFENYKLQSESSEIAVANTIRAFSLATSQEEVWAIVSFEKDNQISYSNPINLKHQTSPTIYNTDITVNTATLEFNWGNTLGLDNTENAIYFEVLTEENNDLISGTYTYENHYTYLDNSNVVLTITPENAQQLKTNTNYGFAIMGVSEDNWVNFIAEKNFSINN